MTLPSRFCMMVGDLVKVEGGTLRPEWYGELGIITSFSVPDIYKVAHQDWYEVTLVHSGRKVIRSNMLVKINEDR